MASLTGASIASSYTSLLKLSGNTDTLADGTGSNAIQVVDGNGDASPLYLNTDRIGLGGQPDEMLHIESATASQPVLKIENTTAHASNLTNFGILEFKSTDTNGSIPDNNVLGEVQFIGHLKDHPYSEVSYAKIQGVATDPGGGKTGHLAFFTNASSSLSEKMRISSDGNVGIGASPNSFHADQTYLQIGGTGSIFSQTAVGASKSMYIGQNIQFDTDGSVDVITEDESSLYEQNGGRHYFYTAPSHASISALSIQLVLDANSRISLSNNDNNDNNTVFGYNAFTNNGTVLENINADRNTVFGHNAMGTGTTTGGYNNVAIGSTALEDHISADSCVAIGSAALNNVTSGIRNIGIGTEAGTIVTTGADNIAIGTSANLTSSSASNQTVIGISATAQGDNSVTLGNASVTDVYMSQDSQAYVHAQNVPNHVSNSIGSPYYKFDGTGDAISVGDASSTMGKIYSASVFFYIEDDIVADTSGGLPVAALVMSSWLTAVAVF